MMDCKNLSKKQKVSGLVGLIIIVAALVGGIVYSKQAKADDLVASAPEATRINVSEEGGVRACDIFQGNDGTTREQIEAFAKRTGCKLNAWRKDISEKLHHAPAEAASDEKAPVAPTAPTLNVAPATPAKTISSTN